MRVMCIKEVTKPFPGTKSVIVTGEIYNVVREHPYVNDPGYELAEDIGMVYRQSLFAPISNATDEEIEEEYQQQEAADLDRELAKIVHEYENA